MPVTAETHREWARLGARARLIEIENERAAILKAYPDLRRTTPAGPASDGNGRPKRKLSAAARKRMSAGMRKYWARRKGKPVRSAQA